MWPSNKHKEAGRNVFMSSIQGLANVVAFAAAFLLTPKVHAWSVGAVTEWVRESWGYGWDTLTWFIWGGIVALGLFFLTRATIATAIVVGGFALATRFF